MAPLGAEILGNATLGKGGILKLTFGGLGNELVDLTTDLTFGLDNVLLELKDLYVGILGTGGETVVLMADLL